MHNQILQCRKDDVQLLLLNSFLLSINKDWFTTAHGHHNHTMTTLDLCLSGKSNLAPFELTICYHCIVGLFVCWADRYAQKSLQRWCNFSSMGQSSLATSLLANLAVPGNFPEPGNAIISTVNPKEWWFWPMPAGTPPDNSWPRSVS